MATALPLGLKTAAPDVHRFAMRASQLNKFRPIVSYWCEYYILQQILSRQLHTADEECAQYALQLMDKLEDYKAANASNDAVVDDVAAKAYVENFALETFNRAEEAQRTDKVTKQTADTFQASATFMDLLSIWEPLEPEIQAKVKYAKYHALRIAKAYKAGENPNLTNTVVEQPLSGSSLDDELETELRMLENDAGEYKAPTVETIPDSRLTSRPHSILQNESWQPPTQPAMSQNTQNSSSRPLVEPDASPLEAGGNKNSRADSLGGGYFPTVPGAPSTIDTVPPVEEHPTAPSVLSTAHAAEFYYNTAISPTSGSRNPGTAISEASDQLPFVPTTADPPTMPLASLPSVLPSPPVTQAHSHFIQPAVARSHPNEFRTDDDSVMAAQKHAKWAISALNFEDVNTAVKELRIALQSLGA